MAPGSITSWKVDGKTVETVADFIFLGSKIAADGDRSHEIKRLLLLGRKVTTNLDSILKSRGITLSTKVRLVKAMVFPVVMNGCESWTIKKAEHWRIDAFELWCCGRLLRVPWTARRSNQSILKKISPEYSLEGLILKLKLQYFGHLMWRADSFEKTLILGKIEGRRRRGRQRMRWLDDITDSMDMVLVNSRSWWWTGRPGVQLFMGLQRVRHDWVNELNWTDYAKAFDCVEHNKLKKSSRREYRPPPCLVRNLYAGHIARVRIRYRTTDWFQIGKGVCQGCILSPCLFNLYSEYLMWNAWLDEA